MQFLKWFKKASEAATVISSYNSGQPVWTPRDYEKLAREAYLFNTIAHRCVKIIAANGSAIKWILKSSDGEQIHSHAVLNLLERPNPINGGAAFFESVLSHLMLAGNAYIEAVGLSGGQPAELWAHRPDRMKVIPGNFGVPVAYQYEVHGRKTSWQVENDVSPILHLKEFHPLNDWYGQARVESAAMSIDWHNAGAAHNTGLLQNGARISGAMVFKPVKTASGTMQAAPQQVIDAAIKELLDRSGPANAGKPLVLGGNVDWLEMGTTPKDMDFDAGMSTAARQICVSFGVPFVLLVDGSSTFNNVSEAKLSLWEDTILPLVNMVRMEMNNWLLPMFGEGLKLEIDLDFISALEPRREQKRLSTVALLKSGIIDNEEARKMLDFGLWKDASVQKIDPTVLQTLINGVAQMGFGPLLRYGRSVGLYLPSQSDEDIIETINISLFVDEDDDVPKLEVVK